MKKTTFLLALIITAGSLFAQKQTTTSATVSFDATTEKDALPKAANNAVIGAINPATGEVAFEAAVKNFAFANPKMQEHFNGDKWFNSTVFPVFSFTGKIDGLKKVKFNKDGVYKVMVTGEMKVKDVSHTEKIAGTITIAGGKTTLNASFNLKLADYNITGAPVDAGKVAKEPKVTVLATF